MRHANRYPTRIAQGPKGRFYVTDASLGALFVYDPNLRLVGELTGLASPLGVAVDETGHIYVGNDGRSNVEIYRPDGRKRMVIADGQIAKPNDIVLDRQGRIFVAASAAGAVEVYGPDGLLHQRIDRAGDDGPRLSFPCALAIAYRDGEGELFVADQGASMIRVFDLEGRHLRSFGGKPVAASDSEGRFVRLQSLAIDGQGRLHALDLFASRVQILDRDSGGYIAAYGHFGDQPGELNLPLDVAIAGDRTIVANADSHRVEVVHVVD